MAAYDIGYEDERFQHPVGHTLHCSICTNVLKDPVMCRQNEHLYCRACITPHLMNFQTCPTCMEPLTVDTLSQASRGIRNLLAELKIRCEFVDRGCGKFIELGDLDRHVAECGFAPAVCSNEGCQQEGNKRDLLHHETSECEERRVKCHSCNEILQEMDTVKVNLAAMNEKLDRNEKELTERIEERIEANGKTVEVNVVAKVELVQEQLNNQEETNVETTKSLYEITNQLEKMTQTLHEVQAEQEHMKKGIAEADGMDKEPKVVIVGGENESGRLKSVELFSVSNGTWKPPQPMRERRQGASLVVFVIGGYISNCGTQSIEKSSMNAVQASPSIICRELIPAVLPNPLHNHCSVVYNRRLIVIGGYDGDQRAISDSITEVSLVPPYTSKLLAAMPQTRWFHGVALFGDKIVIVGGVKDLSYGTILKTVLLYDISKNECKELAPLPYPACQMATVKWGDDNVIIMGGADSKGKPLNKVRIYNIKTQKSYMLPDMKYKRQGCVAAVVRDTVIVMGGKDERNNYLKSVESFRFDRYSWEELPEMHEARWAAARAAAVY